MTLKYAAINLLFVLVFSTAYGRDSVAVKSTKTQPPYWAVKLPMLNVLDLNSPNLQVGIERRLNRHTGVQFTAGGSIDPNRSIVNGFRLKGEYRHYFGIKNNHSFFYGAEAFYTQYSSYVSETFVNGVDSSLYEDHFTIYKKMYGVNAKFGYYKIFRNHFLFEVYSGLGLKHKIVTQHGRTNPSDAPESSIDLNLAAISRETGETDAPSMPLNIAIGYIFR